MMLSRLLNEQCLMSILLLALAHYKKTLVYENSYILRIYITNKLLRGGKIH